MEIFNYLLKVSACSALFFAFYLLVLRKLTFFRFNRFYLLGSLLLSFIIPAMQFTVEREVVQSTVAAPTTNIPVSVIDDHLLTSVSVNSLQVEGTGSFNWFDLLPYLYGAIVAGLLALAGWRLFQLFKHTKAPVKEINGLKLVAKGTGFTNCSFFNYVFIDEKSLTHAELSVLLAHEEVHARQYHSVDKLLLMIAKAFLWFNPIIYLYDKELEQAHEYEADELTSRSIGTETYATLLLNLAVSKSQNPLLHNFVKSPIKQRIKMLFNSKSKNMKKLAYLLALPIGLGLIWLLATEVVYANVKGSMENAAFFQDKPFVERVKTKDEKGYLYEKITINSPGKPLTVGTGFQSKAQLVHKTLWFFINKKLYTEAEVQKFDAAFIKGLPTTKGLAFASNFDIPGVEQKGFNIVVWIGVEPKLSENAAKNKAIYQKYNGTTVSGTVIEYSYSPSGKLMDGFILKTNDGVLMKAFVEAKFVKQANGMISKGDQISIKIYNASYWKDNAYPVIHSFKLMKDDKVLFDRWPKMASRKTSSLDLVSSTSNIVKTYPKPVLLTSSGALINNKTMITYIDDAILKIFNGELKADKVEMHKDGGIVIARKATFKTEKGIIIESDLMTFNTNTGAFNASYPTGKVKPKSEAYTLLSKLSYANADSIKTFKVMDYAIIMRKNVKMDIDNYAVNGKIVAATTNSNVLTVHNGSVKKGTEPSVEAKIIEFNITTKEVKIIEA